MDFKKIIDNKLVFGILYCFLMFAVTYIVYSSTSQKAVTFDGSLWFTDFLSRFSDGEIFVFHNNWGYRPRTIINIINAIPINIVNCLFDVKSKYWMSVIFSFPFYLFSFLVLVTQFLLTFRSKRIDIFIAALALYTCFIIQAQFYAVCELNLASSFILLLYHYLCADIQYKKTDIILIIFLAVCSYASTEAYAYIGYILFALAIYYAKKSTDKKSKIIKYLLGINCLLAAVFQIVMYKFFQFDYITFERFHTEMLSSSINWKDFDLCVDLTILFLTIYLLFRKNVINIRHLCLFNFLVIIALVINLHYYSYLDINYFLKRFYIYIALPILIIICFIFDINKKKFDEGRLQAIYTNLIILFLLIGTLNFFISIISTKTFDYSVEYFKRQINKFHNQVIIPERDLKNFYSHPIAKRYFNCDTFVYDFINFNTQYEFDSILSNATETEGCPQRQFFEKQYLHLPYNYIRLHNVYWNLNKVQDMIENNPEYNKLYKPEHTDDLYKYNQENI